MARGQLTFPNKRLHSVRKGRWLGLAAWQNGAFRCAPRDRWTGWKPAQQFRRLEMVANNTRFLVLSEPGVFPNLAPRFLAGMTRWLSDDWLEAHGHGVLLAETFCDPEIFASTMYRAVGEPDQHRPALPHAARSRTDG